MSVYWQTLAFTAKITTPIFIIVIVGVFLRRSGQIDANFINKASKLIFNLSLPLLLFVNIYQTDSHQLVSAEQIGYMVLVTLVSFASLWFASQRFTNNPIERGCFVQGACRSNLGIIGIALCGTMYGAQGFAKASILLAVITPLYNILSTIVLTLAVHRGRFSWFAFIRDIITNPLLLAIAAAVLLKYFAIGLPEIALTTAHYFAAITLPLALLVIGGSLSLSALYSASRASIHASLFKVLWLPVLVTLGGYVLGYRGIDLGVLFLLSASPTATVSFVMAEAIGGQGKLAANIIVLTTLASMLTISIGIYSLRLLGVI